jgi:monofunctional biosynthetic peptidoglycan transglycosylase
MTPSASLPTYWRRIALRTLLAILALPAIITVIFAFVPLPITPLMVIRFSDGMGLDKDWVALEKISPNLGRSVLAAEDATFCEHFGFEPDALRKAWRSYQRGGRLRGGSTISMQTAKNVFLWPDRNLVRKALEAWLTVYIEVLWTKRRTMEVYLNIVEWAPGVYGAEAAAQHHFKKSAASLNAHEAALLAAVLPSPRRWSASKPGPYVRTRAQTIEYRAARLGPLEACISSDDK